jgi:hypothetical protein|tara:strand:+ start:251 stop:586 length:336 start_codon:yes stop_codon:yes gene_type:complete
MVDITLFSVILFIQLEKRRHCMFKPVTMPKDYFNLTSNNKYGLDTLSVTTNNMIKIPKYHDCIQKNKSGGTQIQSAVANYNKRFGTAIVTRTLKAGHKDSAKFAMIVMRKA